MIRYSVGEVIRKERKAQKISQEELCDGICTPSWLSKVESGASTPTIALFEALMQRLGKNSSQYVYFKGDKEMEIERTKYDIRNAYTTHNKDDAIKLYELLKELSGKNSKLDQQFILLYEILLFKNTDKNAEEKLALFWKALNYSIEDFKFEEIMDYLLSKDELIILNNIALNTHAIGEREKAIEYLKHMKTYLENPKFDYGEKRRTYPTVIYNLAKWIGLESSYWESLGLCDLGIEFCIKSNSLRVFPSLLFMKGYSLIELGLLKEGEIVLRQSYHLLKAMKFNHLAEICENHAAEKLGLKFDD